MFKSFSRTSRLYFCRTKNSHQEIFNQKSHLNNFQIQNKKNFSINIIALTDKKNTMAEVEASTSFAKKKEEKFTNRLINEKSPYLLQHAHNPVDWYPWGEEAIKKAKAENKLIFLSVGYSTCHWCHVMEKESFENEKVATFMNDHFVNIKVDREQRPDIDKIYMNFVLMVNGSGGWPMSVWLTPHLTPVSAGTYFPPKNQWGMPSFMSVMKKISDKWIDNEKELYSSGKSIIRTIENNLKEKPARDLPESPEDKLDTAVRNFRLNFDKLHGGIGTRPKFPEVPRLNLLFHAYAIKKDSEILDMVLFTLRKIAEGGIHDHIFGGFSRYSVDREWHVPHFEKMLYDQGQLMQAYATAYKITMDGYYLEIADNIFNYIVRDLRNLKGGFYAGEDADSYPEIGSRSKVEGAYYAWDWAEIRNTLFMNADEFPFTPDKILDIYAYHYDVRETGNISASSDPHENLSGKNVLIIRRTLEEACRIFRIPLNQIKEIIKKVNSLLLEIRNNRPRPHLDTKIITAWNGLMLTGLSTLASCGGERTEEYLEAAKDLIQFLKEYSYDADKQILFRACYGKEDFAATEVVMCDPKPIEGFLDDYAFLVKGLIDYYEVTLDKNALDWAQILQDTQDKLFLDRDLGGYFYSQATADVVVRLKDDHDGAEPCGNSITARNLYLLSVYFENERYLKQSLKLLFYFENSHRIGYVLPQMLSSFLVKELSFDLSVIVSHDLQSKETMELLKILRRYYIPRQVMVHYNPSERSRIKSRSQDRFKMLNNKPTVYLCHNKVCQMPLTEPQKLQELLHADYITNRV